jgi:hypothetical protein
MTDKQRDEIAQILFFVFDPNAEEDMLWDDVRNSIKKQWQRIADDVRALCDTDSRVPQEPHPIETCFQPEALDCDAIAETLETKGEAYRVGYGNGYNAARRVPRYAGTYTPEEWSARYMPDADAIIVREAWHHAQAAARSAQDGARDFDGCFERIAGRREEVADAEAWDRDRNIALTFWNAARSVSQSLEICALCEGDMAPPLPRVAQPTDAEIDAAAMEYGKTAHNGYPGPGPRSQFRDGARWALTLYDAAPRERTCEHGETKAHDMGYEPGKPAHHGYRPTRCPGPAQENKHG